MDPFYQMESLMNNMMANPFGGLFGMPSMRNRGALMPFGGFGGSLMPSMDLFSNFDQMANNCHSFSSSTIVSYTTDENGRPQVYRSTESTRAAPGGIRETKKTLHDTRSGVQKMSIGHHMEDKAHIIERSRNRATGEDEEVQEFQNLEEEEAAAFNHEWEQRINRYSAPRNRYIGSGRSPRRERHHHHPGGTERLAITNGTSQDLHLEGHSVKPSSKGKHGKDKSLRYRRETNIAPEERKPHSMDKIEMSLKQPVSGVKRRLDEEEQGEKSSKKMRPEVRKKSRKGPPTQPSP